MAPTPPSEGVQELQQKVDQLERRVADNSLKEENDSLKRHFVQLQENSHLFQSAFDSMKTYYRNRLSDLEEQLSTAFDGWEAAEQKLIFVQDRCKFIEEQSQWMVQKSQYDKFESSGRLKRSLETVPAKVEALPASSGDRTALSAAAEDNPPQSPSQILSHLQQVLKTREEQLERLTRELDATNHHCLLQMERLKSRENDVETLSEKFAEVQRELRKERLLRQELQGRVSQKERCANYRSALSNSSVPVMVAVPDIQQLRQAPFLIPPHEFLADLRAEIDTLVYRQSLGACRGPLSIPTGARQNEADDSEPRTES